MSSEAETRRKRDPVAKAIQVLTWMIDEPGDSWGVRGLAQSLGMPPSTIHSILTSLTNAGFVVREDATDRYRLSMEFLRLARRAASQHPIQSTALPALHELQQAVHETALLGVYDWARKQMMFAASAESEQPLRYVVALQRWEPIHAGASGQAIFAFLPEAERREILATAELERLTPNTIVDPVQLEQRLRQVRQRGYAFSRRERIPGAVGIAAPVWGPDDRVIGCICLTVPEQRFHQEMEPALANMVMASARQLSEQLGGHPPRPDGDFLT